MNTHDTDQRKPEPPPAPEPAPASGLWDRLRESIEQMTLSERKNLDSTAQAARLAKRAQAFGRRVEKADASPPLAFLAFSKGTQRYGIPIGDVLEVQALDHFSPVPKTPAFIRGVVHWRGAILALLDPEKLFGAHETGIADLHLCIIVEAARRRVAVLGLGAEDIISVPVHEIKEPPNLAGAAPAEWLIGVHEDDRLILRMDAILNDPKMTNWRN